MHDHIIKDILQQYIENQVSIAFECAFTARVQSFNLYSGTLVLVDVIALPVAHDDKSWFWTAQKITVKVDWTRLYKERQAHLTLSCDTMTIESMFSQGEIAIKKHAATFMQDRPGSIPIIPDHLCIHRASITVHTTTGDKASFQVTGALDLVEAHQYIGLTITHDRGDYAGRTLTKNMELSVKGTVNRTAAASAWHAQGTLECYDPLNGSFFPLSCDFSAQNNDCEISCISQKHGIKLKMKYDGSLTGSLNTAQGDFTIAQETNNDGLVVFTLHDQQGHRVEFHYDLDKSLLISTTTNFIHTVLDNMIKSSYTDFLRYKAPCLIKISKTGQTGYLAIDITKLQLRIPYTYNFVREVHAQATYNTESNALHIHDLLITTDRGTIKSGQMTVHLDDQKKVSGLHLPIVIHDYFINHAKDFFAQLSGACTITYQKNKYAHIQGKTIIKKCHIRNNPFSGDIGGALVSATLTSFHEHPLAQSATLALDVNSYEPIDIKTPFLKARAHLSASIGGTIARPQLYGSLEIVDGNFNFPYKALDIKYGKIFFVDNALDDPTLDICAQGIIKGYMVTLYVQGSASAPLMSFNALPSLQEEQIISLLLAGSPDSSLSLVMPLSSMGTLEKLILGSSQDSSELLHSLKNMFRPLDTVKLVPRFSDQTSRGGLRAALAIEAHDNVTALIQQNFSLSEDVLLEVAYKPMDEFIVRGMRDERGDFGAEIETCFTW